MKTRKGVVRAGWVSPVPLCGMRSEAEHEPRRSWGEDSFLPPNSLAPEPPARRRAMARRSAKPRHLGASSPSGNVRGECRGWTPLDQGRKIVEWERHNIEILDFEFRQLPSLKGSPPEAQSPIPFQKESPRQTKKNGKAMGRGRNAEALRGVGGIVRVSTESERTVKFRATTHAKRAISQSSVQNRFDSYWGHNS